jgi:hypothetical protein
MRNFIFLFIFLFVVCLGCQQQEEVTIIKVPAIEKDDSVVTNTETTKDDSVVSGTITIVKDPEVEAMIRRQDIFLANPDEFGRPL